MPRASRRPTARIQVVFVCTGNTCRSPMAEAILRSHAKRGLCCTATSAGIAAVNRSPASPEGVAVLREWGFDISRHRSRSLTRDLVDAADLLVPLTISHYAAIVERFPESRAKTLLLGSFLDSDRGAPHDITDPIGGSIREYRETRDEIAKAVDALAKFLAEW